MSFFNDIGIIILNLECVFKDVNSSMEVFKCGMVKFCVLGPVFAFAPCCSCLIVCGF